MGDDGCCVPERGAVGRVPCCTTAGCMCVRVTVPWSCCCLDKTRRFGSARLVCPPVWAVPFAELADFFISIIFYVSMQPCPCSTPAPGVSASMPCLCCPARLRSLTHMHVGASRPAHAGWCACSWASMRLHISPNASQHPPPPVGCAPTPGAHTHPYALARPGLRLVPSLKQQPWGNAGTTGRVPLSTLIPPDSAHMVSWASPAPCSCIPKILRPRTGGSSLLPTPRAASWDQH